MNSPSAFIWAVQPEDGTAPGPPFAEGSAPVTGSGVDAPEAGSGPSVADRAAVMAPIIAVNGSARACCSPIQAIQLPLRDVAIATVGPDGQAIAPVGWVITGCPG